MSAHIIHLDSARGEPPVQLVRLFSFNAGGISSSATLAGISEWLNDLPGDTNIIVIQEAKVLRSAQITRNLANAISTRFGNAQFDLIDACFTQEQADDLFILETDITPETAATHQVRKGGQLIFIRTADSVRGSFLEHGPAFIHPSTREVTIQFVRGFSISFIYGQASSAALPPERTKHSYHMSKSQTILDLITPAMSPSHLIVGDLNLNTRRLGRAKHSPPDRMILGLMEDKNFVNAHESAWPEGIKCPYTYKTNHAKTSPDAILCHQSWLDKGAILELSINNRKFYPNQVHSPIGIVFSPTLVARPRPKEILDRLDSAPPSHEDFISAFPKSVPLLRARLDPLRPEQEGFVETITTSITEIVAQAASEARAARTAHRTAVPHINHEVIRGLREQIIPARRALQIITASLRHWDGSSPLNRPAPIYHVKRDKWERIRFRVLQTLRNNAPAAINPHDLEVPGKPHTSPPSQEVIEHFRHWTLIATPILSGLLEKLRDASDTITSEMAERELQRWHDWISLSPGRWISMLRARAARQQGRAQAPQFRTSNPGPRPNLDSRDQETLETATKSSEFWADINAQTPPPPNFEAPQPWHESFDRLRRTTHGRDDLEAEISIEEIRLHTKAATKAMSRADNNTPNAFFHLVFLPNDDEETEAHLAIIRLRILWLFRKLFEEGASNPNAWKIAEYVCLYKSGDKDDPANYRPIALLPALYKIYTGILTTRLTKFVEQNDILSFSQRGGRPGMSTYQLIHQVQSIISYAKHAEIDFLSILFIDLKKAYNSVPHWAIPQRLRQIGAPESFVNAVDNLYKDWSARIRLQNILTEPHDESRGVRQGDPLSPILWILFLDPLLVWIKEGGVGITASCSSRGAPNDPDQILQVQASDASYVDDMAFFPSSDDQLKTVAERCGEFFSFYGLEVGVKSDASKTAIMPVCGTPTPTQIQGQTIPILDSNQSYKYLGLHIRADMDPCDAFEHVRSNTELAARILSCGGSFTPKQITFLANSVILPLAQYRTRLVQFSNQQCRMIDKIIRKGVRKALRQMDIPNAIIHGSPDHVLGGLGIISLEVQQRADFLGCLHNTISKSDNPALDWLIFLDQYQANSGDSAQVFRPYEEFHGVTRLRDHFPQLYNAVKACASTNTRLVAPFEIGPFPQKPPVILSKRGEISHSYIDLHAEGRIPRARIAPNRLHLPLRTNMWRDHLSPQLLPFAWAENGVVFSSFGNTKDLNFKAAPYGQPIPDDELTLGLQAIELTLFCAPLKTVGQNNMDILEVRSLVVQAPKAACDVCSLPPKSLQQHPCRDILFRIQSLASALRTRGMNVEFRALPDRSDRDFSMARRFPSLLNVATLSHRDMPFIGIRKLLLVDPTNISKPPRSQSLKNTAQWIHEIIHGQIKGQVNKYLKKYLKENHNVLIKFGRKLDARAQELDLPLQSPLIAHGSLGSSSKHGIQATLLARSTAKTRWNRTPTNAYLCSRAPVNPNPLNLDLPDHLVRPQSLHATVLSNPLAIPHDTPIPTIASAESFKESRKARNKLISSTISKQLTKRTKEILDNPDIPVNKRRSVAAADRAKQTRWLKLNRRYRHVISDKCSRCNTSTKEDTKHLLRDCPRSIPFLRLIPTNFNEAISLAWLGPANHTAHLSPWESLWFPHSPRPPDAPADDTLAYWLLMGLVPSGLNSFEKRCEKGTLVAALLARLIKDTRTSILSEKQLADSLVFHHACSLAERSPPGGEAVPSAAVVPIAPLSAGPGPPSPPAPRPPGFVSTTQTHAGD